MEMGYYIIQMEIDIKANLSIKGRMERELIFTIMGLFIQVIGLMICNKDMAQKNGMMVHYMKDSLKTA